MAKARKLSETSCREDVGLTKAAAAIVRTLQQRHPQCGEFQVSSRMLDDAATWLNAKADDLAPAMAPPAGGGSSDNGA